MWRHLPPSWYIKLNNHDNNSFERSVLRYSLQYASSTYTAVVMSFIAQKYMRAYFCGFVK